MMRIDGVQSAIAGCVLYGISNVLLDKHGREVSALTATTWFSFGVFILCICVQASMRLSGSPPVPFPDTVSYRMLGTMMVIYFFADYLYLNAFAQKAHVFAITIMATLVPAVAALIKFVTEREVPTMRHLIAWILAFITITLLASE